MITSDLSNIWGKIVLNDLLSMEPRLTAAHNTLSEGTGAGHEFTGWLTLPSTLSQDEIDAIKACAAAIRTHSKALVVVGIGGSYLGARAVIDLLRGSSHNELDEMEVYFAGNHLSTRSWNQLMKQLDGKDWSINIISKSGGTTEPAVAARLLRVALEEKYGVEGARERIVCTTDAKKGILHDMAQKMDYQTFPIPGDVGGRYSVLTAVGLLPLAVAGVDIDALLDGAREAQQKLNAERSFNNPAWQYAAARNLLYEQGKKVEILCSYEPDFSYFGRWWQQLFGESEGKDHKSLFPTYLEYSADLHSMGQLVQEGERNMFETLVRFDPPADEVIIGSDEANMDQLNFLAGKSLSFVQSHASAAVTDAHRDGGVPVLTLDCGPLNEHSVGALLYFFELACGISAYVLGVNPFNQPGVEAYKKNMYHLLGKPGY